MGPTKRTPIFLLAVIFFPLGLVSSSASANKKSKKPVACDNSYNEPPAEHPERSTLGAFRNLEEFEDIRTDSFCNLFPSFKADTPKEFQKLSDDLTSDDLFGEFETKCVALIQNNFPGKRYLKCDPGKLVDETPKITAAKPCVTPEYSNFVRAALLRIASCVEMNPRELFELFSHESGLHFNALSGTGAAGPGQLTVPGFMDVVQLSKNAPVDPIRLGRYNQLSSGYLHDGNKLACKAFEDLQKDIPDEVIKKMRQGGAKCPLVAVPNGVLRNLYMSAKLYAVNRSDLIQSMSRLTQTKINPNYFDDRDFDIGPYARDAVRERLLPEFNESWEAQQERKTSFVTKFFNMMTLPFRDLDVDHYAKRLLEMHADLPQKQKTQIQAAVDSAQRTIAKKNEINAAARLNDRLFKNIEGYAELDDDEKQEKQTAVNQKLAEVLSIYAYNGGQNGVRSVFVSFLYTLEKDPKKPKFSSLDHLLDEYSLFLSNHYRGDKRRREEVAGYYKKVVNPDAGLLELEKAQGRKCFERAPGRNSEVI